MAPSLGEDEGIVIEARADVMLAPPHASPEEGLALALRPPAERAFLAEPISGAYVYAMLRQAAGEGALAPTYGEIAEAIALSSNEDPLFPGRADGCARTAAILVALAWRESQFRRSLVGDQGRSYGLYQIQARTAVGTGHEPGYDMLNLVLPRPASMIAIDLVRRSLLACAALAFGERLSWYATSAECSRDPRLTVPSSRTMAHADSLFRLCAPPEMVLASKPFPLPR